MIEHLSSQKLALAGARSNNFFYYAENGLTDAIWRGDRESSEMVLQIPYEVIVDRNQTKSTLGFDQKKYQNKSMVNLI